MANEGLTAALSNLGMTSNDMPLGMAGNVLAQNASTLVDPRGTNLGLGLAAGFGTALLAGLLKYQARQQAAEQTAAGRTLANQMMYAKTPAEREAIAMSAENTNVRSNLLSLSNALNQQALSREADVAQTRALEQAKLEVAASPLGKELAQMQTDRIIAGITARGEEARKTQAEKLVGQKELQDIAQRNSERLKKLGTDEALRLKDITEKNAFERLKQGVDYEAAKKEQEQQLKAYLDDLDRYEDQKNALQKIEFANQLKQAGGQDLDPTTERNVNLNTSVADRAYKLANKIEKLSYLDFKGGLKYTNLNDDNVKSEFEQLLADILKAKSGTGVSQAEYERTYNSLAGDFTGGVTSAVKALRTAGDIANNLSLISLQGTQQTVPQKYQMIKNLMESKKGLDLPVALEKPKFPGMPEPASGAPSIAAAMTQPLEKPAEQIATATPTATPTVVPDQQKAAAMIAKAKQALALPDSQFSVEKKRQVIQAVKDELNIDLTAGVQ